MVPNSTVPCKYTPPHTPALSLPGLPCPDGDEPGIVNLSIVMHGQTIMMAAEARCAIRIAHTRTACSVGENLIEPLSKRNN